MNIYIWHDGKILGPFSRAELFTQLKEAHLTIDVPACFEGDAEWRTLRELLNPSGGFVPSAAEPQIACGASTGFSPQPITDSRRRAVQGAHSDSRTPLLLGLVKGLVFLSFLAGVVLFLFFSVFLAPIRLAPSPLAVNDANGSSDTIPRTVVSPVPQPAPSAAVVTEVADISPKLTAPATEASETTKEIESDTTVIPEAENLAEGTLPVNQQVVSTTNAVRKGALAPLPEPMADDFFKIHSIKIVDRAPRGDQGTWLQLGAKRLKWTDKVFVPYIELTVQTAEQYESKGTFVRVCFFDSSKKLIKTLEEPAIAWRDKRRGYSVPALYPKGTRETVYFPLPEDVDLGKGSLLALFGDKKSAVARLYPATASSFGLDFPERSLVERRVTEKIQREAAINPVIEMAVETRNPKQPTMTLFMRMPIGMKDARHANGVLALCLLANNADQIRTGLQKMDRQEDDRIFADMKRAATVLDRNIDPTAAADFRERLAKRTPADDALLAEDMGKAIKSLPSDPANKQLEDCRVLIAALAGRIYQNNLVKFADKHQLAILAWGARRLWDPKLSYDEQTRKINREMDETFDDVADAWEKGIDKLSKQYGFPNQNILLTGQSGAAQYACRLALRKPERFLAVRVHIPSSFDKPTPEARQVLWLLTTGEKEGGYPSAKRFFNECKQLGYPMIFKAIPGLGHQGSRVADDLALNFFEYALTLKEEREAAASKRTSLEIPRMVGRPEPWPVSFKRPISVGDILNQEVFTAADAEIVSPELRVDLPTDTLAASWMKN